MEAEKQKREENKMKKFSVIFVVMLVALMMFVSCNGNTPTKERPATKEEIEIGSALYDSVSIAIYRIDDKSVTDTQTETGNLYTFDKTVVKDEDLKLDTILNGTYEKSYTGNTDTFVLNLTSGTQVNGKDHTMYYKYTYNIETKKSTIELVLDGNKLTGVDKIQNN